MILTTFPAHVLRLPMRATPTDAVSYARQYGSVLVLHGVDDGSVRGTVVVEETRK